MGQKSGTDLAGCFLLKVSQKVIVKLLTRATVISRSSEGGSTSKLTHMVADRPQFLGTWAMQLAT